MKTSAALASFSAASFITVLFTTSNALACTCAGWANAQQAAQDKNVIVAKVRTLALDDTGEGRLAIDKVYKGAIDTSTVDVIGQDGGNCNGEILPSRQPWIVLLTKDEEGYSTVSCADSWIKIDPKTQKIKAELGEEFLLSEAESKDVLDYKVQPTVKGLECYVTASRSYVPYDPERGNEFNFDYSEPATTPKGEPLTALADVDLSSQGTNLRKLHLYATAEQRSPTTYDVSVSLLEPFFSTRVNSKSTIDMRSSYIADATYISRYTNIDGSDTNDPSGQPFLAHDTLAECGLTVGAPLVPVQ